MPRNQVFTALFVAHRYASDDHHGRLRARPAEVRAVSTALAGEVQHRSRALPACHVDGYTEFVTCPSKGDV